MPPQIYYFASSAAITHYTPELYFNEIRPFVLKPLECVMILVGSSNPGQSQDEHKHVYLSRRKMFFDAQPLTFCLHVQNISFHKRLKCRKGSSLEQLLKSPLLVHEFCYMSVKKQRKLENQLPYYIPM